MSVNVEEIAPAPVAMVAPELAADRHRRRGGGSTALLVVFITVSVLVAASFFYRLPKYTLGPGSVRETAGLITVNGGTTYPPMDGVAYTTVSVDGRINVWQALAAWLDPETDVVPESLILQGKSAKESQQANLAQMDDSKDTARKVALSYLGLARMGGGEVVEVVPDSPASTVLQAGDIITAVGSLETPSSTAVIKAVTAHAPGDRVAFTVQRAAGDGAAGRTTQQVEALLTARTDRPQEAFFGIQVRTWFDVTYPYDVSIDSGQVGGPSAGLAFTLGLIDALTPGELTGGAEVAATGTIAPDGTVGPIGGLEHKVDAVRRAGVRLFLVPASQTPAELAEARHRAKGKVDIVAVHDLDEAVQALAAHGGQSVPRSVEG